jgi:uncharacterized damage-inducible protein DinB
MNVVERLHRELAYNAWANQEALRSILAAKSNPERCVAVMAHIIAAEWLWLRRLGYAASARDVWPALPLAACEREMEALSGAWQVYIDGLTPALLDARILYTNSKGEEWSSEVADVLTHVVLHASYHRGQIASLLGRAGETAAYTDYIECVRRGYLANAWPAPPRPLA